ncbi:extracellular catalytic domain type 1 short-chain-length polyhydroxyalkanoate depolymerase [Paucimonas lemoignei]|nr:PHB depolymerase family esterase [Paucimonas lemoignei]
MAVSLVLGTLAASAHALTPGSGTWVKETNLFGLADAYTYVPKNTAPATIGKGRALMITLHGCGMTASGNVINKKYNWEDTAEKYGMVVVAPTVPSGTTATRTYSGCWDWFGANHSRSTRDEAIILKLVDAVKSRSGLDIDPDQIYITGLSAGGGLVVDLACVAPDYFAGVGINAGPALNTPGTAGVGSKSTRTAQQVANDCRAYAGSSYGSYLDKQITSVVNGSTDSVVDPTHDWTNRDGMKLAYGANTSAGTFTEVKSTGTLWKDNAGKIRVSYIEATGMGHAWPAGAGGSGGGLYVDYTHVNYPAYVTQFFFDNNLRVQRGDPKPVMTSCSASVASPTATAVTINGAATDNGSIASYSVSISGPTPSNDNAAGSGPSFSKQYTGLANGSYTATVKATDNVGGVSDAACSTSFQVGPIALVPPSDVTAPAASVTANEIVLNWTNISGATSYTVTRTGGAGTVVVSVPAASGTTTSHKATGLLEKTSYTFTVQSVGSGSTSALSALVTVTTKSAFTCTQTTASNYAHVQAGRAYTSGGYAYAKGSATKMGLYNMFYTSTLAETSAGYFDVGNCPK